MRSWLLFYSRTSAEERKKRKVVPRGVWFGVGSTSTRALGGVVRRIAEEGNSSELLDKMCYHQGGFVETGSENEPGQHQ